MNPGNSIVQGAMKLWLIRGLVATLVGVGGFAAYQVVKTSQPKNGSVSHKTVQKARNQTSAQSVLLTSQAKTLLGPQSQTKIASSQQQRLIQSQAEDKRQAQAPSYCPETDSPIYYRPYNYNFTIKVAANWCFGFGYDNTRNDINNSRDWYFFTPLKVGKTKPEEITGQPFPTFPLNDNYFCGPAGLDQPCGPFYDYTNAIDNNNRYASLPIVESILSYDNQLSPRMPYHTRLFTREWKIKDKGTNYRDANEQDIKDFIKIPNPSGGSGNPYLYPSRGAGYFYNERLSDQIRARLSGDNETDFAKKRDYTDLKTREDIQLNSDPLDLKFEKEFPWSKNLQKEYKAGRVKVYAFDLYVPCLPPDTIGEFDNSTNEQVNPLLSGERTKLNPTPSVLDLTQRQAQEIDKTFQDYKLWSDERGEISDGSNLSTRDFIDYYYGGCLDVFGRRTTELNGAKTYWESTGGKAYLFFRPADKNVATSRYYEFRTDSPKLIRYECLDSAGSFNQCQSIPVGGLSIDNEADFLEYFLGNNLSDFKNVAEVQEFVNACGSNETSINDPIPMKYQDVAKGRVKWLLQACRFTNWWIAQERHNQEMLHSFQFCDTVTTKQSDPDRCNAEQKEDDDQ